MTTTNELHTIIQDLNLADMGDAANYLGEEKGAEFSMKFKFLPVGSLVYVNSYGPYWGLRGIICAVDVIAPADAREALYFYFVALQEGPRKEPVWFMHDDVADAEGDNVALWHTSGWELSPSQMGTPEVVSHA